MICKYQRKPQEIEVIQWDGKQETFDFLREHSIKAVPFFTNAVKITSGEEMFIAEVNDYIILGEKVSVMKENYFNENYSRI